MLFPKAQDHWTLNPAELLECSTKDLKDFFERKPELASRTVHRFDTLPPSFYVDWEDRRTKVQNVQQLLIQTLCTDVHAEEISSSPQLGLDLFEISKKLDSEATLLFLSKVNSGIVDLHAIINQEPSEFLQTMSSSTPERRQFVLDQMLGHLACTRAYDKHVQICIDHFPEFFVGKDSESFNQLVYQPMRWSNLVDVNPDLVDSMVQQVYCKVSFCRSNVQPDTFIDYLENCYDRFLTLAKDPSDRKYSLDDDWRYQVVSRDPTKKICDEWKRKPIYQDSRIQQIINKRLKAGLMV